MIIASGFIDLTTPEDINHVRQELFQRGVEVPEENKEKLIFLIERENEQDVKAVLNDMQYIEGVRAVYLNYFSLPGADAGPDLQI